MANTHYSLFATPGFAQGLRVRSFCVHASLTRAYWNKHPHCPRNDPPLSSI